MNIGSYISGMLSDIIYLVPCILVALAFHEWAHAFAAYKLGDPTAYNLGRMTLNPFSHIDPIGFIMLLLVRFGWAKPVPITLRNLKNPKRDEIIVALAGVTVNLLLAFVFMGVFFFTAYVIGSDNTVLYGFITTFYSINLGLCVFNLIPIPPLDGYRVLQTLLIRRIGPRFFMNVERYGYFILIALVVTGILTRLISSVSSGISSGIMAFYSAVFGALL